MRCFEKISFEQFEKDVVNNKYLYDEYTLPKRGTKYSAGYDFVLIDDVVLEPNEILKIPLGIKVKMNEDEMFMLIVRSSIGFKHNIRLTNQVGIIESDYYNNINNEGHMWISVQNHSNETKKFTKGERLVQGIFTKFLTVDNEEQLMDERKGGIGSTN